MGRTKIGTKSCIPSSTVRVTDSTTIDCVAQSVRAPTDGQCLPVFNFILYCSLVRLIKNVTLNKSIELTHVCDGSLYHV